MEIYKDIIGYEGLYQISNEGNVKSLIKRYGFEKVLKAGITKAGYKTVTLCKNKKRESLQIHRIVAEHFLLKTDLCVNHKDCNKLNNNVNNLEWVSYKENTNHARKNGLLKHNTKKIAEEKRKVVLQIDPITNRLIAKYNSAHEAAKITKTNRGNICSCCRGNGKIVNKYKWEYEIKSIKNEL